MYIGIGLRKRWPQEATTVILAKHHYWKMNEVWSTRFKINGTSYTPHYVKLVLHLTFTYHNKNSCRGSEGSLMPSASFRIMIRSDIIMFMRRQLRRWL
jgi:hypothetical protein